MFAILPIVPEGSPMSCRYYLNLVIIYCAIIQCHEEHCIFFSMLTKSNAVLRCLTYADTLPASGDLADTEVAVAEISAVNSIGKRG